MSTKSWEPHYYRNATPSTDILVFSFGQLSGSITNLNFGMVQPNSFTTDNTQTALPNTVVFYAHTYTAGSGGAVSFNTSAAPSPSVSGWVETIYRDSNCNGQLDSGEPQITAATTLTAGQSICIIDRESFPANVTTGAQNVVTVTATFSYANANPAMSSDVQKHTDTTIVSDSTALKLIKAVSSNSALPGSILRYTITYTNQSSQPLNNLVINDATPAFTTFVSASAGAFPGNLTACMKTTPAGGPVSCGNAQPAGGTGGITWNFAGSLQPSSSGSVTFQAQVNQ